MENTQYTIDTVVDQQSEEPVSLILEETQTTPSSSSSTVLSSETLLPFIDNESVHKDAEKPQGAIYIAPEDGQGQFGGMEGYYTASQYQPALALQPFTHLLPSQLASDLAALNLQESQDVSSGIQNSAEMDTRSDVPIQPFYQGHQSTSQWNPVSGNMQQPMYSAGLSLQSQLAGPLPGTGPISQLMPTDLGVVPQWPPVNGQPPNPFTQTQPQYSGPSQPIQYTGSTDPVPYTGPNNSQYNGQTQTNYSLAVQQYPMTQSLGPYPTPQRRTTDQRRYKCPLCNYWARRPGALAVHMRIHTGERPYSCIFPSCNKRGPQGFSVKSNYTRHLRTVHRNDTVITDVPAIEEPESSAPDAMACVLVSQP